MVNTSVLEKRCEPRTDMRDYAIRTRIRLNPSTILSGVLGDLSDHGARIEGETQGLKIGDIVSVEILFSIQYSVAHSCEVRHIEPDRYFGVQFTGQFERCSMWPL